MSNLTDSRACQINPNNVTFVNYFRQPGTPAEPETWKAVVHFIGGGVRNVVMHETRLPAFKKLMEGDVPFDFRGREFRG